MFASFSLKTLGEREARPFGGQRRYIVRRKLICLLRESRANEL